MIKRNTPALATQYLYALLIAVSLLCLIDARTNSMPPLWDGVNYVDMAESGIIGNPNLAAPFAYRPGMPFMSRAVAEILSVSIHAGFRIVTWAFALCLLMGIFTLSRQFTDNYRQAFMPMIILGLSARHIKVPLFFNTLVDVSAFALIVIAFWALLTKRYSLCLVVSSVGLLFKEFMAIPWFLLCVHSACLFRKDRSRRNLGFLAAAVGIGAGILLIPRLCIPVAHTVQFIDPINNPGTLKRLISAWLDEFRMFNIMFATVSYWLPTLLLLTPSRFQRVQTDLRGFRLHITLGYFILVLLLTMYGGTNISVFISYSVAAQAVILALFFRCRITIAEKIYVVAVMLLYNKILLPIPIPQDGFDAYIDFYGGWSSRVNMQTLVRFIEMGVLIAIAACIRMVSAWLQSNGRQSTIMKYPAETTRHIQGKRF